MRKSLGFQVWVLLTLFLLFSSLECFCGTLDEDISYQLDKRKNGTDHFLSRKRRYLTFPEGSSFQMVFCLTYPSIAVGSFFVFGNTAALAWELPSTPIFYNYKDYTTTEAPTTTEAWNIENLVHDDHEFNYKDHDIVNFDYPDHNQYNKDRFDSVNNYETRNPVGSYYNPFSEYASPQKYGYSPQKTHHYPQLSGYHSSAQQNGYYDTDKYNSRRAFDTAPNYEGSYSTLKKPMQRQRINNYDKKREETGGYAKSSYQGGNRRSQVHPSSSYIDPIYHGIHRRTRRDLYQKLQQFLTTLSIDGKNCILKSICEVNKKTKEKGSFIEEIIKTIFRIKPEEGYPNEDDFDHAANKTHVCDDQYPSCKGSIFSNMFVFNNKQ